MMKTFYRWWWKSRTAYAMDDDDRRTAYGSELGGDRGVCVGPLLCWWLLHGTCRNPRRPAPAQHQPGPEPALLVWDRWAIFLHILIFTTAAAAAQTGAGWNINTELRRAAARCSASTWPTSISPSLFLITTSGNLDLATFNIFNDDNDLLAPAAVVNMSLSSNKATRRRTRWQERRGQWPEQQQQAAPQVGVRQWGDTNTTSSAI